MVLRSMRPCVDSYYKQKIISLFFRTSKPPVYSNVDPDFPDFFPSTSLLITKSVNYANNLQPLAEHNGKKIVISY